MSIFGEILNRLRGKARPEPSTQASPQASTQAQQPQTGTAGQPQTGAAGQTQGAAPPATAPVTAGTGGGNTTAGGAAAGSTAAGTATGAASAPLSEVDVEKILDDLAQQSGQKLNWRTSIVDTMKALGIDSSLEHRKELARELQYSGDMNDSAAMNVWLHKRVMKELAANGGKLPPELRD